MPALRIIASYIPAIILWLFVTSHALAQSLCPPGWICPTDPIYQSSIGIWYTIWWHRPGEPFGDHWSAWSRYQPTLGYYSSGDPAVIQAHVRAMKAAGIDYLVLDHTNGIDNDAGAIDKNAQEVFNTIGGLPPSEQLSVAVAIGFQLWGLHSLDGQNTEADRVWTNYATQPIYLRWQGKPLLVNYNAYDTPGVFAPNWDHPRFTIRQATGVVDSLNPALSSYGRYGYWGWVQREPTYVNREAMGIMPGWNTAHVGRQTTPIDREDGMLYQREWLQAIANNPKTILISSWNDFAEEVAIEPAYAVTAPAWHDSYGTEVPDWYLQITAAYAQLRTGLVDGTYYHDEDNAAVYGVVKGELIKQSKPPHGHPSIALPAGTLSALQHRGLGWTVLKGSGPDLFLILDGERRAIVAEDLLANLGFSDPQVVDDAILNNIPQGADAPVLPGRLVSSLTSNTIYFLDHGSKFPVNKADIIPFGFDPIRIIPVSDDILNTFPTGPRLKWPLKGTSRDDIYLAGSGRRQPISSLETLSALGYDPSDVRTVTDRELAAYQAAEAVPHVIRPVLQRPDGRLYLLHYGSKRPTTPYELSLFAITATPQLVSDAVVDAFPSSVAMGSGLAPQTIFRRVRRESVLKPTAR